MKRFLELVFVSLISITLTLHFVNIAEDRIDGGNVNSFGFSGEVLLSEFKEKVSIAFGEAEIKIYNIKPTPDIVGPHEDPKKCICKGSGVIIQGDGHKTVCPYHGSKFGKDIIIKPLNALE